jgi:hypothetical protein
MKRRRKKYFFVRAYVTVRVTKSFCGIAEDLMCCTLELSN